MHHTALLASLALIAAAATGCSTTHPNTPAPPNIDRGVVPVTASSTLVAVIRPVGDATATGRLHFFDHPEGVRIVGVFSGLDANAKHGFHVHAFGDASDADAAKSAGVHFNPFNNEHALPPSPQRHAGSFPNLETDAQGNASIDFIDRTITVTRGTTAILGRSVIIHAQEDVGEQPWGGAGGRIGVGVIGLANPEFTPTRPTR